MHVRDRDELWRADGAIQADDRLPLRESRMEAGKARHLWCGGIVAYLQNVIFPVSRPGTRRLSLIFANAVKREVQVRVLDVTPLVSVLPHGAPAAVPGLLGIPVLLQVE